MKRRDIRKFLIEAIRDNARSYIILTILRQDLEEYESAYKQRHNADLPSDLEAHFMDWNKRKAAMEADQIIETSVDEFIASKFRWLPFQNTTITGICIIPAIIVLVLHALRHYSYLRGIKTAFDGLSYGDLAGTIFSIIALSGVLVASLIDELRKE